MEADFYFFSSLYKIKKSIVFYETDKSFCFVNLKPIVPGHVLISPKRIVDKFEDLKEDEVSDLFITVQKVSTVIQEVFKTTSSSIGIQNGKEAGQTVSHVHVHVLPRKEGDFQNNDDVYKEMADKKNGFDNDIRKPRTMDEMEKEALMLRKFF